MIEMGRGGAMLGYKLYAGSDARQEMRVGLRYGGWISLYI